MDAFSFAFTLFGLLMGLALSEAIGGFGKALELRHKIHIGWLTPLLALLITFDITSLWLIAWQSRSTIPVTFISLAAGLVIFGIYYLIAQLAFPDDIEHWPDLDAYYFQHRRWLMGGMYACNLLAMAGEEAIGIPQLANANQWVVFLAFSLGVAAVFFLPGKRLNMAALLYQLLLYPLFDILGVMANTWF
jgi:cellulose synthase/poly-beta-1,6-N-acetylglucosamine synthase-like glycosyltransferase